MEDFIFAPLVLMVSLGIHLLVLRRSEPRERPALNWAFSLHVVSAFAQVLLTKYYFKGGDMFVYFENGVETAEVMRGDFTRFFPEVVAAFLQRSFEFPIEFFGGGSTQSMSAAAGLLLFLTGSSIYATVLLIALLTYVSQVLLYRALKPDFSRELQLRVLWGSNLLPSAVFWSSALLKEPLVMAALGPLVLGLRWLADGKRRAGSVMLVVPSLTVIAVIKPYVLMALSLGAAVFYLWRRLRSATSPALKPFSIIGALVVATVGLVLGNNYFTKGDQSAADTFARQRNVGQQVTGGSDFQLESPGGSAEPVQRSVLQELLLAPFALLTALFRPVLFEARNAVQLVNALEATVLLMLFLRVWRRTSLRGLIAYVSASPTLLFCAVFTLALAVGTGLSTTNMGTLSRYRAPMMPFFFTLLLVLDAWAAELSRVQLIRPVTAAPTSSAR